MLMFSLLHHIGPFCLMFLKLRIHAAGTSPLILSPVTSLKASAPWRVWILCKDDPKLSIIDIMHKSDLCLCINILTPSISLHQLCAEQPIYWHHRCPCCSSPWRFVSFYLFFNKREKKLYLCCKNDLSPRACRNVESNRFTGWIPDRLQKINNLQWVVLWF